MREEAVRSPAEAVGGRYARGSVAEARTALSGPDAPPWRPPVPVPVPVTTYSAIAAGFLDAPDTGTLRRPRAAGA